SDFIRRIKELDADERIEFHFLGKTDEGLRDIGVHHGEYQRENFARLTRDIRPSFAAVFSIWAETYSHTLTEAWSAGLPVLGSKLGAVGERIAKHGGGWPVDTTDPAGTLALIITIATDNGAYERALREVEMIQFQTVGGMADAYRALYEKVLAKRVFFDGPRVGCLVPPGDRGSTFVRVALPLRHEKMRERLWAARLPAADTRKELHKWIDRLELNTVFVQREALDMAAARVVVDTCRAKNVRVVFEIDDNLLDIADSHADYAFYESRIETVRYLAENADQVVVSTPNLREVFRPVNERISVIGNAIDEWLWFAPLPVPARAHRDGTVIAGYMGTKTHALDLEMIREPFLAARRRLELDYGLRLDLEIVGALDDDPVAPRWYRRLDVPKGCSSYPRFVRWLRATVDWDLALAPLCSEPLNHSKSGLKFFEYAALGTAGIFSAVGEYPQTIQDKETGILIAPGLSTEWEEVIVELAASPALRQKLTLGARQQTLERHLLADRVTSWFSALHCSKQDAARHAPNAPVS
ncbi:MAG: glycosyltransferase, partial [Blastocatellia bacterium]|nr:glycosyltransferase [Blastocatellia bacterium]